MSRVAAVAATLVALAGVGSTPATAASVPAGSESLSDELALSRWANAVHLGEIRSEPRTDARSIGRLRLRTELGAAESYLLLNRWTSPQGTTWIRLRVPGRPNGRVGWVRRSALGDIRKTSLSLELNRAKRQMIVRRNGNVQFTARVGIGKPGTPTPAGHFWIRDRFHAKGGIYGTRAMSTSAYAPYLTDWPMGGIIGVHGTDQPQLIPGRPSHGCIRMRNADIERVYRIVRIGTPLRIR